MTTRQKRRIYWDSVCFISRIQEQPGRILSLRSISDQAEAGNVDIVCSTWTIAEVVRLKGDPAPISVSDEQKIRDFFENPYIHARTLDRFTAELSAKITRQFGVKPKDAVHLATAILWEADEFHTYEDKLVNLDGQIEMTPGGPTLKIVRPTGVYQTSLLGDADDDAERAENVDADESGPPVQPVE